MNIHNYCSTIPEEFTMNEPWEITANLARIIESLQQKLGSEYDLHDGIAIHRSATIDSTAVIKSPAIIGANCFVGMNALLRNGVYLAENVSIEPGCEIKQSVICSGSVIAHFNFIGDSIIGSGVNIEAGAVLANHHNEHDNKSVTVRVGGEAIDTNVQKFGAVIGDNTKIGANAVTSPGTILQQGSIVKRLELIEQL